MGQIHSRLELKKVKLGSARKEKGDATDMLSKIDDAGLPAGFMGQLASLEGNLLERKVCGLIVILKR